ncbi:MAG: ribbon-helix-helix protein, CopG family [Candidatus Competibacter sp.]
MTTRISRMVGFSVPPTMAEELDRVAEEERRTKSELFREMFRVYLTYRRIKRQQEDEERLDRTDTAIPGSNLGVPNDRYRERRSPAGNRTVCRSTGENDGYPNRERSLTRSRPPRNAAAQKIHDLSSHCQPPFRCNHELAQNPLQDGC